MEKIDLLISEEVQATLIEIPIMDVSEELEKEVKTVDLETGSENQSPEITTVEREYPETTEKVPIVSQAEISMENS